MQFTTSSQLYIFTLYSGTHFGLLLSLEPSSWDTRRQETMLDDLEGMVLWYYGKKVCRTVRRLVNLHSGDQWVVLKESGLIRAQDEARD